MPSLQPPQSTHNHLSTVDEAERRRRNQFLKKREIAARLGIGRDMVEEL
jgi:hypothetical protein